jgi:signal transduction histidine kinase
MDGIDTAIRWFSGGDQQYHTLVHCMRFQWFWISVTVALDLAVAVGYVLIAFHWHKNERSLPPSPARQALVTMRNIFTFCGICGYLFIPIKLFWPAWRLYDLFMVGLVFYTWRYALNVKGLKVLYSAVGRSDQLQSELSAARDDAHRKGSFLNAVSHDLRTPLNGLMLHASLAELHVAEGDAGRAAVAESLTEIKAAARLTAELLDGLLEYARMDGAEDHVVPTEFALADLVADVMATHHHAASANGLDASAVIPPGLVVRTDRLKLERVLNNLVGNAVKYAPAGTVRVAAETAGSGLEIHVTDTGVGIASEHLGRLFDEFYQVENHERDRQKGFGLGLAIGRRLSRQLGGDLAVASTVGRGSRFTVVLPGVVVPPGPGVAADQRPADTAPTATTDRPAAVLQPPQYGRPAGAAR